MQILVSKFGGSSIASAKRFRQVRDILAARSDRQFIILSAPGKRHQSDEKITDLLCAAHQRYAAGGDAGGILDEVRDRFYEIAQSLGLDVDLQRLLGSLEADVRHSLDRASSRGEYLCARLFAAYAGLPFVDATELIHFDENGRIMPDEIQRSVRHMAQWHSSAVIPGFYGALPNGEIKTFSRGGSDISGALVAAALRATVYENWTDVDGLMSIDPAICGDAVCQSAVSYRQMRLLAQAGARVLHPYCLEPVCQAGVPTLLKNTFAPDLPGTYISDTVRNQVPCVCAREDVRILNLAALTPETVAIVEGLSPEIYRSSGSDRFIALRVPGPGIPASLVTTFGLPSRFRRDAEILAQPIASLRTEGCLQYLVQPERCHEVMRRLHHLLMEMH